MTAVSSLRILLSGRAWVAVSWVPIFQGSLLSPMVLQQLVSMFGPRREQAWIEVFVPGYDMAFDCRYCCAYPPKVSPAAVTVSVAVLYPKPGYCQRLTKFSCVSLVFVSLQISSAKAKYSIAPLLLGSYVMHDSPALGASASLVFL